MTRAELAEFRDFFVNPFNGEGLITSERLNAYHEKEVQFMEELKPIQTTVLYDPTEPNGNYWYFEDSRLNGQTVVRVTGDSYIFSSSKVEAASNTRWNFITELTGELLEGTPIVIDFYEP